MRFRTLVINPGSTSTKLAVYENLECVFQEEIRHDTEVLSQYPRVIDQLDYRRTLVEEVLKREGFELALFTAVAARGGRLKPIPSGVYRVNDEMLADSRAGYQGDHASNLACIIGTDLFTGMNTPVYVVDPVSVDEMWPVARISGMPEIERNSLSHALNMKSVARRAAQQLGKPYEECRLIVVHLGGGGSISVHLGGKMVDLYNSDKEGPFAIERSGGIPSIDLVELCFSGRMKKEEIIKRLAGNGGIFAYLGTRDARHVEARAASGDNEAALVLEAYCYQIAKYIGAMAAVLSGQVDAICITGGVAHSEAIMAKIRERVAFIGQILTFPGGEEMEALATGVLRVLQGQELPRLYPTGEVLGERSM